MTSTAPPTTCEYPCCRRAATVTVTVESTDPVRFCRLHADEVLGS